MSEQTDDRRVRRDAEREKRWAEQDARGAEQAMREATVLEAIARADLLPGRVGAAVTAVFDALKSYLASDGCMSYPVIGRTSDVVVDLAAAVIELDDEVTA